MFFPCTDSELTIWLNRFSQALASHATELGFTSAEVAVINADAAMFTFLVEVSLPAYEEALSKLRDHKKLIKNGPIGEPTGVIPAPLPVLNPPASVEPGIVPRLNEVIKRILASPFYSKTLGEELGFIEAGDESTLDPATAKPTGRAIGQIDNEVRVEFAKSFYDGVLIESRRTGQQEWSRLGMDSFSPYVDSRPPMNGGKPEVREYRMRFILRDELIGEWSDILVATASF